MYYDQLLMDNKDIIKKRKELTVRGLSGLKNQGNTCYMNSIIQCLSSIDLFRSWLIKDKFVDKMYENIEQKIIDKNKIDDIIKTTVVYRLAEILKKMWSQNITIIPVSFKKVIGREYELFKGFSQNDSQELLNVILDRIHEETKTEVNVIFPNIPNSINILYGIQLNCEKIIQDNNIPQEEKEKYIYYLNEYKKTHINDVIILEAYKYWKNYIQKSHSIIIDLFTGLFLSQITCCECQIVSGAFEPFNILSIETNDIEETTLDELLSQFTKEELLTENNQYNCEQCKKKVNAKKKIYIWESPNILIIHLKRFKNDNRIIKKTSSKVIFPIDNLDIKNYLSDLHNVNNTCYELWAISDHRGTCEWGHYVSYCKNGINNKWYEFNDDDIMHVPNDNLEKDLITKNAYILFYVRKF